MDQQGTEGGRRHRPLRAWLALAAVVVAAAGCANTKAVGEFGKQTVGMTDVVKTEFKALEGICAKKAELAINVGNRDDEKPLEDCKEFKQAQGRLGKYTVDVLDQLGKALAALVEDKNFTVSSEIQGVGKAVQGLKGSDGKPLVQPATVDAFTKVANLIADIIAAKMRQDAVQKVVDSTGSMKQLGHVLKAYFVPVPGSPIAGQKPPYENWVELGDVHLSGIEATLAGALGRQEPIRARELRREVKILKASMAERSQDKGKIPSKVGEAIDAWQLAVDKFKEEALKPEPEDLYKRLKDLYEKTNAAREAIEKAGG